MPAAWQGLNGDRGFEQRIESDHQAFKDLFQDKHHAAGINFDKYNDIQVETSGRDIPAHRSTFAELDLGRVLNRNIQFNQYSKPTPVQQYAIPISISIPYIRFQFDSEIEIEIDN